MARRLETYNTRKAAQDRVKMLRARGQPAEYGRRPGLGLVRTMWDVVYYTDERRRNPRALPGTVSLDSKPRGGKEPFYAENLYHCKKCNARHLRYSGIGRRHFSLRRKGR